MIGQRTVLSAEVWPQLKQKSTRFKQTTLRFGAIHSIFIKLNRDPVQIGLEFLGIGDVFKRRDHPQTAIYNATDIIYAELQSKGAARDKPPPRRESPRCDMRASRNKAIIRMFG